jgi:hypothetical protein
MTSTTATTDRGTQTVCLAVPLLSGTTSTDCAAMLSCWHGERGEEHAASRRLHGITRESVWIQSSPGGDVAVVLIESPEVATAMLGLATSQAPFDAWFRDHLRAVHGLDLADGMGVPEQILDFHG